ncbi:MAG: glycosyltransferase, partial [Proteobacteria bacterium]|nr:glycosyltransferase [Pseudomonadota bacterium]
MKIKLSILLPVFNEEANIIPLIEELESVLNKMGWPFEVIIVDDGSTDGSRRVLEELSRAKSYLRVICFRRNYGQTAAFDAGFSVASGDIVVTLDSDRQNDPNDIPKMVEMIDQGYDFVAGWRLERKDGFILRTFPSRIANSIIRWVMKTSIHDLGCSLKA